MSGRTNRVRVVALALASAVSVSCNKPAASEPPDAAPTSSAAPAVSSAAPVASAAPSSVQAPARGAFHDGARSFSERYEPAVGTTAAEMQPVDKANLAKCYRERAKGTDDRVTLTFHVAADAAGALKATAVALDAGKNDDALVACMKKRIEEQTAADAAGKSWDFTVTFAR